MRHETQRYDNVRITVEVVAAGAGVTGKTPTVAISRLVDGNFLANGGASWAAGFATNNMVAVDATNLPGLYEYTVSQARMTDDSFTPGLFAKIIEGDTSLIEYVKVDIEYSLDVETLSGLGITHSAAMNSLHRYLIAREDDAFASYVSQVGSGAGTGKFYIPANGPALAASSRYVDRHAVLWDTGAGNGQTNTPCRIGGIFNDGGGDHFLIQNPDGTTFTDAILSVGSELFIGLVNSVALVGAIEDDVITASSLAVSAKDDIADSVWDEDIVAAHVTADTAGKILNTTLSLPTSGDVADQVWDETLGDHLIGGSSGARLNGINAANIAAAVWDESIAGHLGIGSTGESLDNAGSITTPGDIADAVWDENLTGHLGAGKAGRALAVTQGLVQGNHRLKNPTYDPAGRLLTAQLRVYPTSGDAIADTGALFTFNVSCTYDGDGNLTSLLSAE